MEGRFVRGGNGASDGQVLQISRFLYRRFKAKLRRRVGRSQELNQTQYVVSHVTKRV